MTLFSLNLNKIALLRNSRGGDDPNFAAFAQEAIDAGVKGLTVHPRADARHITLDDVVTIARLPAVASGEVEFNIEGDLRPELLTLAETIRPTQFTVVPVRPGEVTSGRGWRAYDDHARLIATIARLEGIRVSVFVDATPESAGYAVAAGADGIELYTGPFAMAHLAGNHSAELSALAETAKVARDAGLRINAGHDLTLDNLPVIRGAFEIDEVSIGHHVTTDALRMGWTAALQAYIAACA